jgi:hypothetical protein
MALYPHPAPTLAAHFTSAAVDEVWQRVAIRSASARYFVPNDGRNWSGQGGQAAMARDLLRDWVQVEVGAYETEAIPTSGSAATRAGERLRDDSGSRWVSGGRLSLEAKLIPKGARSQYAAAVRLWTSGTDYAEIAPATGVLTVSIGGSTNTTSAITWSQFDTLEIFVAAGGDSATVVKYRVNGGAVTTCTITGSALGTLTVTTLDLLCSGTSSQLAAWVQTLAAWPSNGRPSWAT